MGSNSFIIKGWSITLVSALFALAVKDADKRFMLISYFPICVFWVLDSFFLHQEALFRKLYDRVALDEVQSTYFPLNPLLVRDSVPTMLSIFFSKTILGFHGVAVLVVLFAMFTLT